MPGKWSKLFSLFQKPAVLTVLLAVLTIALFLPACRYGFVNYDDNLYVYENSHMLHGLNWSGLIYAFKTSDGGSWMPVTWISYMLDASVFGAKPAGYHFTNILLHAASVALLFQALLKMTKRLWPSVFVAAVFALHPLRAESVVWIAERKDVLSVFFFMLGLLAYARYVARPDWKRHAVVMACLLLSLMAKPMVVSFPFVLLLLDFWPLNRAGDDWSTLRKQLWLLVREKIPLMLVCALVVAATILTQKNTGAIAGSSHLHTKLLRVADNYSFYVQKIFWPVQTSILYPVTKLDVTAAVVKMFLLAGVSALILWKSFRLPWLLVGWFWFLGTLLPVVGFIHIGHIFVADRYSYLPSVGLTIALAWGVRALLAQRPSLQPGIVFAGGAVLLACVTVTRTDLPRWENSFTLYDAALKVGHHHVAYNNRGAAFIQNGNPEKALDDFDSSIRLKQDFAEAYGNRAQAWTALGKFDQAIADCSYALELDPNSAVSYSRRGEAFFGTGNLQQALTNFTAAIHLKPDFTTALVNRSIIWMELKNYPATIADCTEAIRYAPDHADAWSNRGNALNRIGQPGLALNDFNEAIRLTPANPVCFNNRAAAYFDLKQYAQARADLEKCRALGGQPHPGLVQALDEVTRGQR